MSYCSWPSTGVLNDVDITQKRRRGVLVGTSEHRNRITVLVLLKHSAQCADIYVDAVKNISHGSAETGFRLVATSASASCISATLKCVLGWKTFSNHKFRSVVAELPFFWMLVHPLRNLL